MFKTIRRRIPHLVVMAAATVMVTASWTSPRAQAYTSPIDITGGSIQMRAVVPDRDTGKPVDVPLPLGLIGPKMQKLFSTPLSTQLDQFWSVTPDSKTGKIPRDKACDPTDPDSIPQQVKDAVAKIDSSYSAYNISCNLSSQGKLLTQQVDSALYLGYLLTNNSVDFTVTTPYTCNADHTSYFCPNDPRYTVTFATEIWTVIHTPALCDLNAENGTVDILDANIDSHNFSASFGQNIVDALFLGHKFSAAERTMESTVKTMPLPLDDSLKELRDNCKGSGPTARLLQAFTGFETSVDSSLNIVFRMSHPAIAAPALYYVDGKADPNQPTFTRPILTPSQPLVTAGNSLVVDGKFFPVNSGNSLHITLQQPDYYKCFGGATEIEWGPAGGQTQVQQIRSDATGNCAGGYDATSLALATTYQFRARNCDALTCSPWSALIKIATGTSASGNVILTLDGDTQIGTAIVTAQGTFETTVTVPAGTTAGDHTVHAVNGDVKADASLQVSAATGTAGGANATLAIVSSLGTALTSTQTDAPFTLFGNGFAPGTVTVALDSVTGMQLGTATVGADGTFRKDFQVAGGQAGPHTLVAVENGTAQAKDAVTFVLPSVVR